MTKSNRTWVARLALACLVAVVMTGCAGVQRHKSKPMPTPEPGKGLVYFFRPSSFIGGGVQMKISDADKTIGALQSGTYFFYQTEPGTHQFGASTEAENTITMNVEAGKTYYVEGSIGMGLLVGHGHLKEVDATVAHEELPKLDYATLPTH